MDLKDLTITALGKGLYSCECAPDDTAAVALPQTFSELQALLDRAKAGEDVLARRDLFDEMQQALLKDPAWGTARIVELCNGEAPNVLLLRTADATDGGATIKAPLSPERIEAIKRNASKDGQARAEVSAAAAGVEMAAVADQAARAPKRVTK